MNFPKLSNFITGLILIFAVFILDANHAKNTLLALTQEQKIKQAIHVYPPKYSEPVDLSTEIVPAYPKEAMEAAYEARVTLELVIDTDGKVLRVQSVGNKKRKKNKYFRMLERSAIAAYKKKKFSPALNKENGKPVISRIYAPVMFRMGGKRSGNAFPGLQPSKKFILKIFDNRVKILFPEKVRTEYRNRAPQTLFYQHQGVYDLVLYKFAVRRISKDSITEEMRDRVYRLLSQNLKKTYAPGGDADVKRNHFQEKIIKNAGRQILEVSADSDTHGKVIDRFMTFDKTLYYWGIYANRKIINKKRLGEISNFFDSLRLKK